MRSAVKRPVRLSDFFQQSRRFGDQLLRFGVIDGLSQKCRVLQDRLFDWQSGSARR
jgi:hypothetical protein